MGDEEERLVLVLGDRRTLKTCLTSHLVVGVAPVVPLVPTYGCTRTPFKSHSGWRCVFKEFGGCESYRRPSKRNMLLYRGFTVHKFLRLGGYEGLLADPPALVNIHVALDSQDVLMRLNYWLEYTRDRQDIDQICRANRT